MKAILIKSTKELSRGLVGEIKDYVVLDGEVNAIFIDWKGRFHSIPISHLGKGESLGNY